MNERRRGTDARKLEQLRDEATDARRRFEDHKRAVHDRRRRADPVLLRELQRRRELAEGRLSRAEGAVRAAQKTPTYELDVVNDDARIEAELKRDPNRTDTKVARAAGTPFTAVRGVRERLGLFLSRD